MQERTGNHVIEPGCWYRLLDEQIWQSLTIDDILGNNVLASNFKRRFAVTYGFAASATGLSLDLKVGLNFVAVNIRPNIQNRFPVFPDDYLGTFGGAQTLYYAFR